MMVSNQAIRLQSMFLWIQNHFINSIVSVTFYQGSTKNYGLFEFENYPFWNDWSPTIIQCQVWQASQLRRNSSTSKEVLQLWWIPRGKWKVVTQTHCSDALWLQALIVVLLITGIFVWNRCVNPRSLPNKV